MKRLFFPVLMLVLLAVACQFGATAPTATPIPLAPATSSPLPPTAAPATDLPATIAPATATTAPAEPSATAATGSQNLRAVVRLPGGTLQIVDTGFAANGIRLNQSLLPAGGAAGQAAYVLNFTVTPSAQRVDATGTTDLPFVASPNYGLAVWPGTAAEPARLAWATSPTGEPAITQLFIAAADGSSVSPVLTETITAGDPPYQLVAERWSSDGQLLYFSREPYGIGGYILFDGASNLYRYNLADGTVTELIPANPLGGGMLCLDDLSVDFSLAVGHCADPKTITIRDLSGGPDRTITAPGTVTDFNLVGDARFSPDGQRVAFALAKGSPDDEQGYVAVSDSLDGASNFIATTDPGSYYSVLAWLDNGTLLLQLNKVACTADCDPSLWTIGIGGDNLTKLTDGSFLTLIGGG